MFLMTGCATAPHFVVGVNSLRNPNSREISKYVLYPGSKDTDSNDLQFQEFAGILQQVLDKKGMSRVDNPADADAAIFVVYGIGNPERHQYSYSIPTFGQTGGGSASYSGSSYGSGGAVYTQGTVYEQPTFGVTGSVAGTGEYTTFSRYLFLTAIDADLYRKTNKEIQLWNTRIVSVGSSGDLRWVLPFMIAGAEQMIGTDTGRMIEVSLSESDERVAELRGKKSP